MLVLEFFRVLSCDAGRGTKLSSRKTVFECQWRLSRFKIAISQNPFAVYTTVFNEVPPLKECTQLLIHTVYLNLSDGSTFYSEEITTEGKREESFLKEFERCSTMRILRRSFAFVSCSSSPTLSGNYCAMTVMHDLWPRSVQRLESCCETTTSLSYAPFDCTGLWFCQCLQVFTALKDALLPFHKNHSYLSFCFLFSFLSSFREPPSTQQTHSRNGLQRWRQCPRLLWQMVAH